MGPLGIYLIVCIISWVASMAIKRHKNIPVRPGRTLLRSLLLGAFLPAFSAFRKARPVTGRDEKESAVLLERFTVNGKKKKVEGLQRKLDRLNLFPERSTAYKVMHPEQWFPSFRKGRLQRRIGREQDELRSMYEQLGRAERRFEGSKADRFVNIRYDFNEDGKGRFLLPYDISPEQRNEIRQLIMEQFGVSPNDTGMIVTGNHRSSDQTGFQVGTSVLVFDSKDHTLSALGKAMDDKCNKLISDCMCEQSDILKENGLTRQVQQGGQTFDVADTTNVVTLDPISNSCVALNMNGVTLAYAVAGEDGKVRTMGHSVKGEDRHGMALASKFNELLKNETTMEGWIKAASKIALSPENIRAGITARDERQSDSKKLKMNRAMRQRILRAPKKSVSAFKGLKI